MQNSAVIALLGCAVCAHAAGYTTYIRDANPYQVLAIAMDAGGNAYITGSRVIVPFSLFPYRAAATDVFVSKLDPSGNLTLLATFSGKGSDQANGIAVDPSGNIYIAGNASSLDFPLHHPLQSVPYSPGVGAIAGTGFLMKLSADGTVLYSTHLGGTPGMPADGVFFGAVQVISCAFFAKIDPAGSQILYAEALTSPVPERAEGRGCFLRSIDTSGRAIAVDLKGNAHVTGDAGGGLPTTPGALPTKTIKGR